MDKRTIGYWIATGLFCAVLGFSGVAHFGHFEEMVASMTALGYPTYFMTILGAAIIVSAGLLIWWRERARARRVVRPVPQ